MHHTRRYIRTLSPSIIFIHSFSRSFIFILSNKTAMLQHYTARAVFQMFERFKLILKLWPQKKSNIQRNKLLIWSFFFLFFLMDFLCDLFIIPFHFCFFLFFITSNVLCWNYANKRHDFWTAIPWDSFFCCCSSKLKKKETQNCRMVS